VEIITSGFQSDLDGRISENVRAVLVVESADLAQKMVLGLPIFIRTLRQLRQAGFKEIWMVSRHLENLRPLLNRFGMLEYIQLSHDTPHFESGVSIFSAQYHYESEFIRWVHVKKITNPSDYLGKINPMWWHRLEDSKASLKAIEKKIFQNIKDKTEGWVAPHLNKPVSFAMTRQLVKTDLSPNTITFVNLALAVLTALLIMNNNYGWRVLGAILMQFSSIIDGCDGEVARIKILSSRFGAWFDTIADDLANNLFWLGVFVGLFRTTGNTFYFNGGWVLFGLSFLVSLFLYYQMMTRTKSANVKDFVPAWSDKPASAKEGWFEKVRPLMKRDFFVFLMFVLLILDLRVLLFWISTVAISATFLVHGASFVLSLVRRR